MTSFRKVWVKNKDKVEEDAFKVDCDVGMDIDSLKSAIVVRKGLPPDAVQKIYRDNSLNAEAFAPYDTVVKPGEEEIGGNGRLPYYYSLGKWCYM